MTIVQFTSAEKELIFELAEDLTGTLQKGSYRREILVQNVSRRMQELGIGRLADYLLFVETDEDEFAELISALTIHTTSWFRESPHFDRVKAHLSTVPGASTRVFRLWCAACSTGEEVLSFALLLETLRRQKVIGDYQVIGSDIDPVSVSTASAMVYSLEHRSRIPSEYQSLLVIGRGKGEGLFTVDPEIRRRVGYFEHNLVEVPALKEKQDIIVCRNVLIYFSPDDVKKVFSHLVSSSAPRGLIVLGHSESIDATHMGVKSLGNATYEVEKVSYGSADSNRAHGANEIVPPEPGELLCKKRILVVDDSPTMCHQLRKLIESHGGTVVDVDSADAADKALGQGKFDIISLDLNMPGRSGTDWLAGFREKDRTTPVVVVSDAHASEALGVLGALESGAQDYIEKKLISARPAALAERLAAIIQQVEHRRRKVAGQEQRGVSSLRNAHPESFDLVLLGASTGGTEALSQVLQGLGTPCPPVFVVQHISNTFASAFAARLAAISGIPLAEIRDGVEVRPDHIYLCVEDRHLEIREQAGRIFIQLSSKDPVHGGHRPGVDPLFLSVRKTRKKILACLLTGMGKDGALGLKHLRDLGAMTVIQDEATSVVFGMPGEALKLGAAKCQAGPRDLRRYLQQCFQLFRQSKKAA